MSLTAGRGLSISGGTINAEVASEDLDSVRQVAESANRTASGFAAQIGKANQTAEDAKNVADAAKTVADSTKSGMMTDGERSKLASVERGRERLHAAEGIHGRAWWRKGGRQHDSLR